MKEGTLAGNTWPGAPTHSGHSLARMGGLASIPRRSPDDDAVDGQSAAAAAAAGRSDRADSSGADAGAWKERRRRRRERRRAANELEARSHVRGDTAHWAKTAARHSREAVRTELRARMRLPWGGGDRVDGNDGNDGGNDGGDGNKHLRVVIDLGMQHLMCDAEIKSTVTQLQCSYASVLNLAVDAVMARCPRDDSHSPPPGDMLFTALERKRRAARRLASAAGEECEPPRLLFSSLDGRIAAALARDEGSARWPVTTSAEPFREAAAAQLRLCAKGTRPIRRIVVLSPDAPAALTDPPSPEDVYVIGGLCDYKRIANATLDRADAFGVDARRLPIEETLGTNLNVNILTVNQTCECLFRARLNGGDWADALRGVLPKRKMEEVEETRRRRGEGR